MLLIHVCEERRKVMMVAEQQVRVVRCGGSRINFRRAVFSSNGKYLLCASGDFIKVFTTITQQCIHVLQGHSELVTGIELNPKNPLQLYSCSLDGTVKLWDFVDAIVIKDEYVVTVKGLKLLVYYFKRNKYFRFTLKPTNKNGTNNLFTVVKCHPKEDCIATGHEDGKIRLWRKFNHKQDYTYSTLHWHHDAVADLAFSMQGSVLFSGGVESVLVQWSFSLEHKKEFLPRLGAAIENISTSPDGSLLCISHNDNEITIIDAGLKISGIIQGLIKGTNIKTDLDFDPRTKALVCSGNPGHLQFYSLHDDKPLYNLDIVHQEFVHQSGLQYVDVVNIAFSSDGNWLATVEELQGKGEDFLDVNLKLWEFSHQLQSFVLCSRINMPHETQVTSLAFQKDDSKKNRTLVTTGNDGFFKVWVLRDNSDIYRQSIGWRCDFVGGYHGNKAIDCCFSEDGSLLAVGFDEIITIWEVKMWRLQWTICQPPGKIRSLCFGNLSCSKYLLSSTDSGFINCWNVLKCSLTWRAQIDANILQSDMLSENIAAFSFTSGSSNLFIFTPSDPTPLYVHEDVCRGKVLTALFVPRVVPESVSSVSRRWLNRSQLYFLTDTQDLLTFCTKSPEESLKPLDKKLMLEESLPVTPFYWLFGKQQQDQQFKQVMEVERAFSSDYKIQTATVKQILHTPAHVLPPASILTDMFVSFLLISKKSAEAITAEDEEIASENAMEDTDGELQEHQDPVSVVFNNHLRQFKCTEKEMRSIRKTDFSWVLSL
ncbi:WD repeat-containing protein 75 isoform X1 [Hyperolius riggenbachi]|uniref:WD repeat-containing protein 75 isoform X1 n=1 Tax=Hyperolius riggenbachi TaxID=752182 RepID=UPI0035A32B8B